VQDGEKSVLIEGAVADLVSEVSRRFGEVRLRVSGTSMLPHIRPGDLLVVHRCAFEDVRLGDVLLFRVGQRLFAHRVAAKDRRPAADLFITQGDALMDQDPPVSSANVIGRVTSIQSRKPTMGDGFRNSVPRTIYAMAARAYKAIRARLRSR
jgi:signal peptidase I